MKTEKQARLEILSQNAKDLQGHVAKTKQAIEKVLDKNASLAQIIRTIFYKQCITIISILAALCISTISLTITDVLGGSPAASGSPKDKGTLKKWSKKLPVTLKRLVGKTVELLPAIVGNAVGAILSILSKAAEFVAKPARTLVAFLAGLIMVDAKCKKIGMWSNRKSLKTTTPSFLPSGHTRVSYGRRTIRGTADFYAPNCDAVKSITKSDIEEVTPGKK